MSKSDDKAEPTIEAIWRNAIWLGAIPLSLNVLSLLSTSFITRSLGAEEFGRFSVGVAVVGLTGPLTDCGLRVLAGRDLARAGAGAHRLLNDLLSLRLGLAIIATVATWLIALFVSTASGLRPVIFATSLTIIPVTVSGSLNDGLMARDKAKVISKALFVSGLSLTILSVLATAAWNSAAALAAAYVVGPVANLILLIRASREVHGNLSFRWRPRRWRLLLRRGFPFFRVNILGNLVGRLDTLLVGTILGNAAAGVYSAAVSLSDKLYIVVDSVASAALPTLSRLRHDPARVEMVLGRVTFPLFAVLGAGTLILMAASTPLVALLFGNEFAHGGIALTVAALCIPFLAVDALMGEGLLAMRREADVISTGLINQVITLALLPVCVLFLGMNGARIPRLFGTVSSAWFRARYASRLFSTLWTRERMGYTVLSIAHILPFALTTAVLGNRPILALSSGVLGFGVWGGIEIARNGGVRALRDFLAPSSTGS